MPRPAFEGAVGGQGRGEKDLSAMSKQEKGRGTAQELNRRDFRQELERQEDKISIKRQKVIQAPAAGLDADDPVDVEFKKVFLTFSPKTPQ